ncbi:MAG: ATP-binding protein [Myxococcales bacterium]|jgi:signal transduction histidine kinase
MADLAAGGRTPRILLVKDEVDERAKMANTLRAAGFEVLEVGNGLAGIEAATASRPDLLLVDLHLPDLDGSEVASTLRRLGLEGLPIVAIGKPGDERGVALSAGCDGTIPSPPDLAALPGQVREYLAGKRDKLRTSDERRYLRVLTQSLVEKLEAKVRELAATSERLQRVDEFKTEFVQAISHELSTPLTPLAGYLKILQSEKLGPLNERQKKVLEAMLQSADRLSRTIDNLSDFAVLETGHYRVRAEPISPVKVAEKLVEEMQLSMAKPKHVHITLLAPRHDVSLVADSTRFTQAVGNLLENAINASPPGGEVLAEIVPADGKVRISVYDQGSGLAPEEQEKIFEPFHFPKGVRHTAVVGLGLPVARKIAEAHGGRLVVESPPKAQPEMGRNFSGAKFTLELPLHPPA